jgi:hypothetical protein
MALTDCAINQGYPKDCRDSIAGIKTVYLTEQYNKATLTYASGVITAFTLNSGKKFWTVELEQATATASDNLKPNAANGSLYYEQTLNFMIPKRSGNINTFIKTLAVNDLMAIVLGQDGDYYLLGHSNGLKMQDGSTGSFGTAMSDMAGFNLQFLGMETLYALKVPSNLIATLTSPA